MTRQRQRRWVELLRRASLGEIGLKPAGRSAKALDDAALWSAQAEARQAVEQSGALAERIASSVARHRALIESSAERAGLMASRAEGLRASAAGVGEAFERLGIVALNAGLEGARTAEPYGRGLLLLSEELRVTVTRGAEALRKLTELVAELGVEASEVQQHIDRSRAEASEVGQDAAQLGASMQEASTAIDDLGERLRRATGIDPEVARAIGVAAEHARGLVSALSTLSTADKGARVLGALRPIIAPLRRMLAELEEAGGAADDGLESEA